MVKLILHEYKRCTVVKGDTREVKDFLKKDLKCKWRPHVGPGGWMFPTSRKIELTKKVEAKGYVVMDGGKWKAPATEVDEDDAPLVELFKKLPTCAPRLPHQVNGLHQQFVAGGEDVNVMRCILPDIVDILSAPREKLGLDGKKMTAKARTELSRKDQLRLREMALKCMRALWNQSQALKADTELLQRSAHHILELIRKYEACGAQLENAKAAGEWKQLRALAGEILAEHEEDEDLAENGEEEEEKQSRTTVPVLGHGTEGLVELALGKLGGKATAAKVVQWIEKHKNKPMVTRLQCALNEHPTTAKDRPEGMKVWELTVRGCLSSNSRFQLVDKKRHLWQLCTDQGEVDVPARKKARAAS